LKENKIKKRIKKEQLKKGGLNLEKKSEIKCWVTKLKEKKQAKKRKKKQQSREWVPYLIYKQNKIKWKRMKKKRIQNKERPIKKDDHNWIFFSIFFFIEIIPFLLFSWKKIKRLARKKSCQRQLIFLLPLCFYQNNVVFTSCTIKNFDWPR